MNDERRKPARLLVVGSANMDLVVTAERTPKKGESLIGRDFRTVHGGKGANQAVACARLGAETWMVGRVGDDAFGEALLDGLRREGVHTEHMKSDPDAATGVAMIVVDATGDNSIIVAPGANMRCEPEDLDALADRLSGFDALLVQLEIPEPVVRAAVTRAKAAGVVTVLDAGPARPLRDDLLYDVDVLSPNETEAATILGHEVAGLDGAQRAARELLARGVGSVVIKLGERGALAASSERVDMVPAQRVEVVDTTGAGDAFTAALAVGLAEGRDLLAAVRRGTCAGALAASVFGAQPSMPTRDDVDRFARERGVPCP
ncbi:MAG: ribokinase [Armatimonadota bacterium]